jgi:hypothetical protein
VRPYYCHQIVTEDRPRVTKLTFLTSLEICQRFVFCNLRKAHKMQRPFGESGLQAHPPLSLLFSLYMGFCSR